MFLGYKWQYWHCKYFIIIYKIIVIATMSLPLHFIWFSRISLIKHCRGVSFIRMNTEPYPWLVYIHHFIYYSAVQSHCKCTQKRYNKQNKIEEPQSRGKQPIDIKSVCSCKWNKACIIYKSNTLDLIPAINQLQYNFRSSGRSIQIFRFRYSFIIQSTLLVPTFDIFYDIWIFLARDNITLYHSFWKFIFSKS